MLTPEICHKARLSRDSRFDGKFFTAVLTTGIFCRPICPARAPKEQNVRYYANAEQALEAGFQPCKRCLPELAPATKLPITIKQILDALLTLNNVQQVAHKLHISERHIRRLFQQHFSMSPSEYLLHHRLLLARNLLRNSNLAITEIAFAAGFQSIRRFNEVIKHHYKATPSALRQQLANSTIAYDNVARVELSYRPPFDWHAMIQFFKQRQIPVMEQVTDSYWRRVFIIENTKGYVEVTPHAKKSSLIVTAKLTDYRYLPKLLNQIKQMFDLDTDLIKIQQHLQQDSLLANAIAQNPGLRLPGSFDPFEFSIRAILGQQVSVKAATTFACRIAEQYGQPAIDNPWQLSHVFPNAEQLANADFSQIGLTQKRINTLITWVNYYLEQGSRIFNDYADFNTLYKKLLTLPGIGPWTINYLAMRGLSEPDAFPSNDLGIIKALSTNHSKPNNNAILQRAELWRPWRAYAAIYLWHYQATETNLPD